MFITITRYQRTNEKKLQQQQGEYTSMLGEQNGAITVMKAVKVHIVV
jgi:hypothetical protein